MFKFFSVHYDFPKYFHCAIGIISSMLSNDPWNKFKGILRLLLELHIAFSQSVYGSRNSGLETTLTTQKIVFAHFEHGSGRGWRT